MRTGLQTFWSTFLAAMDSNNARTRKARNEHAITACALQEHASPAVHTHRRACAVIHLLIHIELAIQQENEILLNRSASKKMHIVNSLT